MYVHRKIVAAIDESGRRAVMADSAGQPSDQLASGSSICPRQ